MYEKSVYDVAIIGSGIGGYVSAIRCSQLGMRVALIEKEKVGGTCLNKGCIPTAVLLSSISLLEKIRRAKDYGITIRDYSINLREIKARKETIVNRLSNGIRYLLEKGGVDLFNGFGRIKSRNHAIVENDGDRRLIEAKNIIIATGSRPACHASIPIDGNRIITSEEALNLEETPKNIVIVGGGVIGVEFAQIFQILGANVTILERKQNILSGFDKEITTTIRRILERMGIKIFTNVSNEVAKSYDEKVHLTFYTNGSRMETFTDKVMVAIGRKPNIENIGLEKVGIQLKNGFINVDSRMKTNVPGIYAVGDVVGGKMFAHAAFAEGIVAAENIAGIDSEIDQRFIPSCVYTIPEIACVGLPEDEAISLGYDISVGKFPYTANGKALALGEREGFAKIIVEKKTNRILGAHIIGSNAADLISEALVAIRLEYTSEELGRTIHPHPTLSEVIMEAALAASKEAIHI